MMPVTGAYAPWIWLAAGILLCACESVAPGLFLLWIGLAAIATGLTAFVVSTGFEWTLILFGLYAVASLVIGRRVYGPRESIKESPFLNRRLESLIGREYALDHAIEQGEGRIRVNDTVWRVRGPELPAGTRVRVTGSEDGVLLRVEPVVPLS